MTPTKVIDLFPLMRCLPMCDLEASILGFVSGWHEPNATTKYTQPNICWMEPPAGVRRPHVDPVKATTILLRHQGKERDKALALAQAHYAALRPALQVIERIRYLDEFEPDSPEHIPGDRWLDHLQAQDCVSDDVIRFLRKTLDACTELTAYEHPDFPGRRLSLSELPEQPPATSLIQFQPGCPWGADYCDLEEITEGAATANWLKWRADQQPIAAAIEARWGQAPMYLADMDDPLDDDLFHRFLVLHWCCTCKPDALYVQFLLEASGAPSLIGLKAALLDPENYAHPFTLDGTHRQMSPRAGRFRFTPSDQKTPYVTIAFEDASCWPLVQDLLRQQVDADVLLIDVDKLLQYEQLKPFERYARNLVQHLGWRECLDTPVETLARTDELHVLAATHDQRESLGVSEGLTLLLALAHIFQTETVFHTSRGILMNFTDLPSFKSASKKAEQMLLEVEAHLPLMDEIHVWCDFYASGLWDKRGAMLSYDIETLPWDLIRRLSAWQWEHDCTIDPPQHMGSDAWWDNNFAQSCAIAREVQDAVGPQVQVMVHGVGGPVWIGDVPLQPRPEDTSSPIGKANSEGEN
ncbi:hypothetical protein [Limnohabitans planktonicus]|uniref:Uncharacterized protein n=1 Tax=Limnohabitans planktonicus II-D5 TaxID=1293045 RepID=A0A2T7UE76_9BURK|nr:hypothetical protein [Limnohabitans planktonicus]PVE42932.1 hypothetical protein H663_009280 [Limnohabitans planktonicus II-D5]